ncbi:MAG: metal-dependent hydrolase [Promethearchaeota archaeon]|nr:MAG: metal-dependent hydrolase [Candidatus Lokiarchaeota archaeon]
MDIFTHMFMGVLVGIFTLTILSPEAIIFMWAMTFLLDFDVFLEPLQKIRKMYFFSHKAGSHSYIIGLIFTGIVGFIISAIRQVSFFEVWLAGFIGYSIHVSLDFFAASKIPIFYPISKKEFRFMADRAVNPLLAVFSGINLLILITCFYTKPYYQLFLDLALFYSIIYLTYFGVRALLRIVIQLRLPKNHKYIPGFLPFFYLIYEKNISKDIITFKLVKRSLFSVSKKELINKNIIKASNEWDLYKTALKISQEYRFFHKWSLIIPFFYEKEETVIIILILAESFSESVQHKSLKRNTSSYYLSVIIDKKSNNIISKRDGFSSFKKWENLNI